MEANEHSDHTHDQHAKKDERWPDDRPPSIVASLVEILGQLLDIGIDALHVKEE